MTPSRLFVNLLVESPKQAAAFYCNVFRMRTAFESEWFVQLTPQDDASLELGLLQRDHEIVPADAREASRHDDVIVTLVVEDCDAAAEAAERDGATCVERPRNLFFGQRRALVRAPDGTLLDLSTPCEPDPQWMKRVSQNENGTFVES